MSNGITERSIYTQQLLTLLKKVEEGEIITYEEMDKEIGIGTRPNEEGYCYQKSARDTLERDSNIVFEVVPKVGIKRLSAEQIAKGTGPLYIRKKKSLIKRSKRRIQAINDVYDDLSSEAKNEVNIHRTILAFESEVLKPKNMLKLGDHVTNSKKLVGFADTLRLFNPM
jgi:hypothetical protein